MANEEISLIPVILESIMPDRPHRPSELKNLSSEELYRRYLDTNDQEEAEECRNLLFDVAAVAIRKRVFRKTGVRIEYEGQGNTSPQEASAQDIHDEAIVNIGRKLIQWRDDPEFAPQEINIEAYATIVTDRERYQWFKKFFRTYVGSDELLLLFKRYEGKGLALWSDEQGRYFAGYENWQASKAPPASEIRVKAIMNNPIAVATEGLRWRNTKKSLQQSAPREVLQALLDYANGPVELDHLIVAWKDYIEWKKGIPSDALVVSGTYPSTDGSGELSANFIECRTLEDETIDREASSDFLRILVEKASNLTIAHRIALFLKLPDGVISDLVTRDIAKLDEIAKLLEMSAVELSKIWYRLPMKDEEIAALLTMKARERNPKEVVNVSVVSMLRWQAKSSLQKQLRGFKPDALRTIWGAALALRSKEVDRLSIEQRKAMFLSFWDGFEVVPIYQVDNIAILLEMSPDETPKFWDLLPMSDLEIAELLTRKARKQDPQASEITMQAVSSLRSAAKRFLLNQYLKPTIFMLYKRDSNGLSILDMLPRASTNTRLLNDDTIAQGLQIDVKSYKKLPDLPLRFSQISKIVSRPEQVVTALYLEAYGDLRKSLS